MSGARRVLRLFGAKPLVNRLGSSGTLVSLDLISRRRLAISPDSAVSLGKRRRRVAPPYGVTVPVITVPRVFVRQTSFQYSVHKNFAAIPSNPLEILVTQFAVSSELRDTIVADSDTSSDSIVEVDEQQSKVMETRHLQRLLAVVDHLMGRGLKNRCWNFGLSAPPRHGGMCPCRRGTTTPASQILAK